jgi:hypothetical protein
MAAIGEQHLHAAGVLLQVLHRQAQAHAHAEGDGGFAENLVQGAAGNADVGRILGAGQALARNARQRPAPSVV